MALLTAEQILAVDDLRAEIIPVPEWGGEVRIVTMRADVKAEIEDMFSGKAKQNGAPLSLRKELLARCMVKEDGTPLFGQEQLAGLMQKNAAVVERLFEKALSMNAYRTADVEELEKN